MTETAKPAKSRKKLWFTLALIAFNILVLAGIILHEIHGKEEQILDKEIFVTWAANYRFLVCALCCVLCYILFESLKYLIFIRSFAGRWMPMTALKTAILGKYYDFITPLGSGGQPFQIVYLSTQKKIPIGPATSIPLSGMIVYQVGYVRRLRLHTAFPSAGDARPLSGGLRSLLLFDCARHSCSFFGI